MSRHGVAKRAPAIPRAALRLHSLWSKATIHEALLDLWLESECIDVAIDDVDAATLERYAADVERRANLRRVARIGHEPRTEVQR